MSGGVPLFPGTHPPAYLSHLSPLGHLAVVQLLLEEGADIEQRNVVR